MAKQKQQKRRLTMADIRVSEWGRITAGPIWSFEDGGELGYLMIWELWEPIVRELNDEIAQNAAADEAWNEGLERHWRETANDPDATEERREQASRVLAKFDELHREPPTTRHPGPSLCGYPTWRAKKECTYCGEEFIGLGNTTLCTEACVRARRKDTHVDSKQPRPHAEHTPRPCEHCGESFTPKRNDARFCSPRCRLAHHRGKS